MSADDLRSRNFHSCPSGLLIFCILLTLGSLPHAKASDPGYSSDANPGRDIDAVCVGPPDLQVPLSLSQAVDLALCHNPQIHASWETIRAQSATVGAAESAYWPTLSVSVGELNDRTGYSDSQVPASNATGNTIYGIFDWRLFDFGGRTAAHHAAKSMLEAAVQNRDATVQKVLGSVVESYFSAVTAQASLIALAEDESVANNTLASARRRLAGGLGAQNDVLQATAAVARIALEKNRATGAYQKANALLSYSIGIQPKSPINLPEDVDLRTGTEQKDLTIWLKDMEQHHPAILAAKAAVDAAKDRITEARSVGLPTVDWTANYYQNGFPDQGLTSTNTRVATLGLTVTVPLFNGFLTSHNVNEAKAEEKIKEADLQNTINATVASLIQAYADAHSSLQNLDSSEDLLKAARAAFDSSLRRYTQGAANIVELLNSQSALSDAKSQRLRCISEWRAARLNLLASAGVLSREDVQN